MAELTGSRVGAASAGRGLHHRRSFGVPAASSGAPAGGPEATAWRPCCCPGRSEGPGGTATATGAGYCAQLLQVTRASGVFFALVVVLT
jgi:hypothetical protein